MKILAIILLSCLCGWSQPTPPWQPHDTNAWPLVLCPFGWDASPSQNVIAYRIWTPTNVLGSNSVVTTSTLGAQLVVPLDRQFTVSVVAIDSEGQESDPTTLTTSLGLSNWIEVASASMLQSASPLPYGPFIPRGTNYLRIPQQDQLPLEFFTAQTPVTISGHSKVYEK